MSEKKMKRITVKVSNREIREKAEKYIMKIVEAMDKVDDGDVQAVMKEILAIGYAVGVVGINTSKAGVVGFPPMLNGIIFAMLEDGWKEKMQYAYWDKEGNLYTSDDTYEVQKGVSE